eukprot:1366004-Rhodomonas_salina.1
MRGTLQCTDAGSYGQRTVSTESVKFSIPSHHLSIAPCKRVDSAQGSPRARADVVGVGIAGDSAPVCPATLSQIASTPHRDTSRPILRPPEHACQRQRTGQRAPVDIQNAIEGCKQKVRSGRRSPARSQRRPHEARWIICVQVLQGRRTICASSTRDKPRVKHRPCPRARFRPEARVGAQPAAHQHAWRRHKRMPVSQYRELRTRRNAAEQVELAATCNHRMSSPRGRH